MDESLYEQHGEFLCASELTRGPWDPKAQHGGPVAAILMREFERLDLAGAGGVDMQITRLTCELLRPVPLGDLRVEASVVRPGRRVQLLEGTVTTPAGVEVARARAAVVARAPVSAGGDPPWGLARGAHVAATATPEPPSGPARGGPTRPPTEPDTSPAEPFLVVDWSPKFPGDGIEVRFTAGGFLKPGPATVWFRLRVPLVAGEETSPMQRLAAAADFPNGIASELDYTEFVFINPDLTLYVEREPRGEWICLDASMRTVEGGGAVSEAVLYDLDGRVGRAMQSLYVARR